MIKEASYHGQVQGLLVIISLVSEMVLLGEVWDMIFVGKRVKNTNHEKIKIMNQGEVFSCGISLRVIRSHQYLT